MTDIAGLAAIISLLVCIFFCVIELAKGNRRAGKWVKCIERVPERTLPLPTILCLDRDGCLRLCVHDCFWTEYTLLHERDLNEGEIIAWYDGRVVKDLGWDG